MTASKSSWISLHSLSVYFILAYAISWAIMIPLALSARGVINWSNPFGIHYLASFGPMLSAIIITRLTGGTTGLKELFSRMIRWKVKPIWWLVVVSPILLYGIMSIGVYLVRGEWTDFSLLGQVKFLPNLGIGGALLLWILTYGLGEETGWRGYALPRLQRSRSALSATLILYLFWAIWHLPSFFYLQDIKIIVMFMIGLLAGALTFTWLYNSSGGSILMVALFHGTFNYITASKAGEGAIAAVVSTMVMVWAIFVVIRFKPSNLSHLNRQVI